MCIKINFFKLNSKIEASSNKLKPGEREFIISPIYGANLMQTITNKQMIDHKYWSTKKPFDWMLDEQFLNLQVIFEFVILELLYELVFDFILFSIKVFSHLS